MTQITIRLDDDLARAIEAYRIATGMDDKSAALRAILRLFLREKGYLK